MLRLYKIYLIDELLPLKGSQNLNNLDLDGTRSSPCFETGPETRVMVSIGNTVYGRILSTNLLWNTFHCRYLLLILSTFLCNDARAWFCAFAIVCVWIPSPPWHKHVALIKEINFFTYSMFSQQLGVTIEAPHAHYGIISVHSVLPNSTSAQYVLWSSAITYDKFVFKGRMLHACGYYEDTQNSLWIFSRDERYADRSSVWLIRSCHTVLRVVHLHVCMKREAIWSD